LKAEKPDLSDEEAFAALSTYIAGLSASTPAPAADGATPVPVEGETPVPVEGETAPATAEGETPQEVAPPVEE